MKMIFLIIFLFTLVSVESKEPLVVTGNPRVDYYRLLNTPQRPKKAYKNVPKQRKKVSFILKASGILLATTATAMIMTHALDNQNDDTDVSGHHNPVYKVMYAGSISLYTTGLIINYNTKKYYP